MISKLFSREPDTRVFFATDIHGSETCWRKFLNSGKHYEANIMILGGDMTGKALVPIVEERPGRWHATLLENRREFESEDEVKEFEDSVKRRGYYPFRTDPDEMKELESDEDLRNELFYKEMLGTIERWMQMADERLEGTDIECFVSPGDDDLQLPLSALRLGSRRRPGVDRGPAPQARRAFDRARRIDGGEGCDKGGAAGSGVARSHPRGEGQHPHRAHAVHQPRQFLRAGTVARGGGEPGRRQESKALRTDQRMRRR